MNRLARVSGVILLACTFLMSCGGSEPDNGSTRKSVHSRTDEKSVDLLADIPGYKIYKTHCSLCHGMKGNSMMSGAKDLTVSTMTLDERKTMIRHGKGTMVPYEGKLTAQEINDVAEFIESFIK